MLKLSFDRPHQNILSDETRVLRIRLTPESARARRPLEVAVMLDASSSMRGTMFERAKEACGIVARSLRPEDRLSLGIFHGETLPIVNRVPGSEVAAVLDRALRDITTGYGTRIDLALDRLAAITDGHAASARLAVLVTDGYPYDAARRQVTDFSGLWRQADALAARGITLAAIGLGPASAFHSGLLFDLCELGGGAFLQAETGDALAGRLLELLAPAQAVVDTGATIRLRLAKDGRKEVHKNVRIDSACRIKPLYRKLTLSGSGDEWSALLGELEACDNDFLVRLFVPAPGDSWRQEAREVAHVSVDACGKRFEASATVNFTREFSLIEQKDSEVDDAHTEWLLNEMTHDLRRSNDPMRSVVLASEIEQLARRVGRLDLAEDAARISGDLKARGFAADDRLSRVYQAARSRKTSRRKG
ncbi:vWA domain-containing protein [Azospirillum sp. HJ39]|uniref:VWA domain-containing protein n=1 Tax=Azospirillum sp. HJ39 TaxID=3159496 RepID=UPI003555CB55